MIDIEINGQSLQVEEGSTVIEAAHQLGAYIPHFCYHKKLSIAANCRMCLVQVEKAPKPMPACATPVTNGMKVFTHSDMAVKAQKGVMEFLLINHPLDCPICDQGGECQLQDLSVGYGGGASRYEEAKRVVVNKNLGPLIATDMTRCINCTRCVRFTQEIAGLMELGQAFRGDRAEIMPFINATVDSEISGNIIDLCPVGALTSRPFRFAARSWELSRRKSISPHDALGSNLVVQTQHDKVLRVLPLGNEAINECWLSDRDRYSYEGLNSPERLLKPMVKQDGQWREVAWNQALDYAAHALRDVAANHGAAALGALLSPQATLEELALAAKLMRGLGSENIDFRLRASDFSADGKGAGTPWLGMKIAEINTLDRVLVVGSFLRQEQPLLAQRLRQIVRRGAKLNLIHSADDDLLMTLAGKLIVRPSALPGALASVLKAVCELKGAPTNLPNENDFPPGEHARAIAANLVSGRAVGLFLGNFAQQHPQSVLLQQLTQKLAQVLGARFGFLGAAANSVGGHVARALPGPGGANAAEMIRAARRAYLLLHVEPDLDLADGQAALAALRQAASVIALTSFKSPALLDHADVLLPVAPFAETSGTFINTEGRVQSFQAATKPQGEARPAWKVLRVLGNLLDVGGFDFESSEEVRAEVLGAAIPEFAPGLDNTLTQPLPAVPQALAGALERVADVPTVFADALVRRAPSLQKTRGAAAPAARMNAASMAQAGVAAGEPLRVNGGVNLAATLDERLPDGVVRIAAAHADSVALGALFGAVTVEKA